MNTMPKRAIFVDIDGCLLSDDGNVCAEYYASLSRIAELARSAHVGKFPSIHLCSGRDRNSVEIFANLLGIVDQWHIIEGGTALFNPTTREIKLNPAITARTKRIFKWIGKKIVPKVLKKFFGLQTYPGYLICHSIERPVSFGVAIDVVRLSVREMLAKLVKKRIIKIGCYFNRAVNIAPYEVSKGSAVKFLADETGIDLSWSVAIGDSRHDFSVFTQVGLIGCPENATEECKRFVKERKGKIPHSNYAKAVEEIIESYLPHGSY